MEGSSLNIPPRLVSNSKRNVVKMTLSVIIGFVLCWTPYFVVSLVRIYSDYRIQLTQALSVTEIMALVHSALNPILYGIFNTHMARRACKQLCARCCTRDAIVVRELNVSEDDSTYWTETKIQNLSMVRLSIAQPMAVYQHRNSAGGEFETKREALRRTMKLCLCCERAAPCSHGKPLLVYRRAASDGHVTPDGGQYESFRLRAQSVGGHERSRIRPNGAEDGHERSRIRPNFAEDGRLRYERSAVGLEVPAPLPLRPLADATAAGSEAPPADPSTAAPTDPCIGNRPDDDNSESRFSLDSAVRSEVAEYLANL